MPTLSEIRAAAREHAKTLESVRYLTVQDLAARWDVSEDTVRRIDRSTLRYLVFGKNGMRRYHPDHVAAYEAQRSDAA